MIIGCYKKLFFGSAIASGRYKVCASAVGHWENYFWKFWKN